MRLKISTKFAIKKSFHIFAQSNRNGNGQCWGNPLGISLIEPTKSQKEELRFVAVLFDISEVSFMPLKTHL
jgi:hypothetical protein